MRGHFDIKGHLAMTGNIFYCKYGELLMKFSGQRPTLKILHCTGQPHNKELPGPK